MNSLVERDLIVEELMQDPSFIDFNTINMRLSANVKDAYYKNELCKSKSILAFEGDGTDCDMVRISGYEIVKDIHNLKYVSFTIALQSVSMNKILKVNRRFNEILNLVEN